MYLFRVFRIFRKYIKLFEDRKKLNLLLYVKKLMKYISYREIYKLLQKRKKLSQIAQIHDKIPEVIYITNNKGRAKVLHKEKLFSLLNTEYITLSISYIEYTEYFTDFLHLTILINNSSCFSLKHTIFLLRYV